jgi:riboflavin synthase
MFTGIIEEVGSIRRIIRKINVLLEIEASKVLNDIDKGKSISVNGVCLTVIGFNKMGFNVEVTKESLRRSNLNNLKIGDKVNLERPLQTNGRLDGHFVMGHVDGIGIIRNINKGEGTNILTIEVGKEISKYIVNKGSIAVDGISLTVVEIKNNLFTVNIIPYTLNNTNIQYKKVGDKVNIEVDVIAKYIEKIMDFKKEITKEFLDEEGYIH